MYESNVLMPKYKPVPIPTRGKPWYLQLWIMLSVSRKIELTEDYYFLVPSLAMQICIPKGFICDLASIPRLLWLIIPPDGILMIGGIVHDFYYRYHCLLDSNLLVICEGKGKTFGDRIFKEVNIIVNDMPIISTVTTGTVMGFGWFAWWRNRRNNANVFKDFKGIRRVSPSR